MKELVHGLQQAIVEASQVEVDVLLPPFHAQVAGAVSTVDYGDKVDRAWQSWLEGDTGNSLSYQVHRFPHYLDLVAAKELFNITIYIDDLDATTV